jgi:MFS family permease
MAFNKLMKIGLWSMAACAFFGFSPLLIALAAGIFGGTDVMNEATGSGAWVWLMYISLPLGFVLGIVGFIIFLIGMYKSRPEK